MTGLTQAEAAALAARHVSFFNAAVATRDFTEFLALFTDDAVVRFENVPGAGVLQFAGRDEAASAYATQPPNDKVDICGPVAAEGDTAVIPISWRRDAEPSTIRLTFTDGPPDALDERLVRAMTVVFHSPPTA
jgi:ketosteroid isomerase-like protein